MCLRARARTFIQTTSINSECNRSTFDMDAVCSNHNRCVLFLKTNCFSVMLWRSISVHSTKRRDSMATNIFKVKFAICVLFCFFFLSPFLAAPLPLLLKSECQKYPKIDEAGDMGYNNEIEYIDARARFGSFACDYCCVNGIQWKNDQKKKTLRLIYFNLNLISFRFFPQVFVVSRFPPPPPPPRLLITSPRMECAIRVSRAFFSWSTLCHLDSRRAYAFCEWKLVFMQIQPPDVLNEII